MKVRITGCENPNFWYSELVGEVFDVLKTDGSYYVIDRKKNNSLQYNVSFRDCSPFIEDYILSPNSFVVVDGVRIENTENFTVNLRITKNS